MQVFLDAIYDNYIIFIVITIFLFLALIGYYVDKKTRKESDIKPFFSMVGKNKDPNAPKKEKKKKDKKSKKEYKSVVIGGDAPADPTATGLAQVVQQAPSPAAPANPTPSTSNFVQLPPASPQSQAAAQVVMPNTVTPAMTQPAPTINPVQAVSSPNNLVNQTGVAQAATVSAPPVAQTITSPPTSVPNMAAPAQAQPAEDDDMPMNLNMNE